MKKIISFEDWRERRKQEEARIKNELECKQYQAELDAQESEFACELDDPEWHRKVQQTSKEDKFLTESFLRLILRKGGPDFTEEDQRKLDNISDQLTELSVMKYNSKD